MTETIMHNISSQKDLIKGTQWQHFGLLPVVKEEVCEVLGISQEDSVKAYFDGVSRFIEKYGIIGRCNIHDAPIEEITYIGGAAGFWIDRFFKSSDGRIVSTIVVIQYFENIGDGLEKLGFSLFHEQRECYQVYVRCFDSREEAEGFIEMMASLSLRLMRHTSHEFWHLLEDEVDGRPLPVDETGN